MLWSVRPHRQQVRGSSGTRTSTVALSLAPLGDARAVLVRYCTRTSAPAGTWQHRILNTLLVRVLESYGPNFTCYIRVFSTIQYAPVHRTKKALMAPRRVRVLYEPQASTRTSTRTPTSTVPGQPLSRLRDTRSEHARVAARWKRAHPSIPASKQRTDPTRRNASDIWRAENANPLKNATEASSQVRCSAA